MRGVSRGLRPMGLQPDAEDMSMVYSILAILVCGGAGASVGFVVARGLGLGGISASLVAVLIGMVIATALWALGAALLRKLGWLR